MTSLIFQTGRLQPLSSLQTLEKKITSCSNTWNRPSFNPDISHILTLSPKGLHCKFSYLLSKQPSQRLFTHSNSWISLSAMISLGQATFQSWPLKSDADSASNIVQSPSLANLNFYPPTRFSSAESTALPSAMTPLPHTFLSLTTWKSRLSRSLESLVMNLWANRFAIADRSWSLSPFTSFLVLHPSAISRLSHSQHPP